MSATYLQDYLTNHHKGLVDKSLCELERLSNMLDASLFDTGLWFDEEGDNHITIIFKQPCYNNLNDSIFSIMVQGKKLRPAMGCTKYIECYGLVSLDRKLKSIYEAVCSFAE